MFKQNPRLEMLFLNYFAFNNEQNLASLFASHSIHLYSLISFVNQLVCSYSSNQNILDEKVKVSIFRTSPNLTFFIKSLILNLFNFIRY